MKKEMKWISGGLGFFLLLLFSARNGGADAPVGMTPDLAKRFQEFETRILNLENQLLAQNKKHKEEIENLRRDLELKFPREKRVSVGEPVQAMPSWLEGLGMGGDLRLRYEAFEQNEATRDRNRFRYRFRWKFTKELAKDFDLGFRIVSGSATDPTSTNQTLTGDFTYKSIFLDQAYAKYQPSFLLERVLFLEKAEAAAGKFENPFLQASSGLVWDSDLMPEGAYESFGFNFLDGRLKPFANLGQFFLQENASGAADAEMYGVQSGIRWNPPGFGEDSSVQVTDTLAYYDFSDYALDSNFVASGTSLARGNTRVGSSTSLAAGDFDILQTYHEIQFKMGRLPVKLFGDLAVNLADRATDPLSRDVGYEYGIKLGSAKRKGDWEASYYYAYVEPNAVVGAFSESDFGAGHADKRGSHIGLKYMLTDSLRLGISTYFVNNVTGADDETRRFQTDLEWVF